MSPESLGTFFSTLSKKRFKMARNTVLTRDELKTYLKGKKIELKTRPIEHLDIEKAPFAEIEYILPDRDGLSVRIRPNGIKSFIYRYRLPHWEIGTNKRYTYKPNFPQLTLKEARIKHAENVRLVAKRIDLNDIETTARMQKRLEPTVNEAFEEYKDRYLLKELKAPEKQISYFEKDISLAIGKRKIKEVSRRELIMILDKIVDRSAPIQANRTLSSMKKFFGYCVGRGILNDNPALQIAKSEVGGKENQRDRFLSFDEIKRFFERIDTAPFSRTVQLVLKILLLTGQRAGEICNAEWSEIDFKNGIWTIPAEKAKNRIENRVSIHDLTLTAFQELKALSYYYDPDPKQSRFVCQSPQVRKQVKGKRKSAAIIKEIPIVVTTVNRAVKRLLDIGYYSGYSKDDYFNQEGKPIDCHFGIKKWVPHDLRRTVATHLNDIGIAPHVVEKILNHRMQGVMAVYNKADYWDERVEALKLWNEKIKQIIADDKVVSIRKKEA